MISRAKAFEFVPHLMDHQGAMTQRDLPAWIAAIREHLEKAEDKWKRGKHTVALHEIGCVAAFSVSALEQNGGDIRDDDPLAN